jgi:mono/diheme cytochrome c family protein
MKKFPLMFALMTLGFISCAQNNSNVVASKSFAVKNGRALFLKNCVHCHGADARGDEGPDLHKLDWTDAQIIRRIRTGKSGQMTAFAGKLSSEEMNALVVYLRTLN